MIKPETFLSLPPQQQMKYQKEYQAEYQRLYEEIQRFAMKQANLSQQRNVVQTSIHENDMVRQEFNELKEDGEVYKMVGPTLLKMDLDEAKDNVKRRIDLFAKNHKKITEDIEKCQKEVVTRKKRMDSIDMTFKNISMLQRRRQQMMSQQMQRQQMQQQQQQQGKGKKKGGKKK